MTSLKERSPANFFFLSTKLFIYQAIVGRILESTAGRIFFPQVAFPLPAQPGNQTGKYFKQKNFQS
jgi:hypothetical protein